MTNEQLRSQCHTNWLYVCFVWTKCVHRHMFCVKKYACIFLHIHLLSSTYIENERSTWVHIFNCSTIYIYGVASEFGDGSARSDPEVWIGLWVQGCAFWLATICMQNIDMKLKKHKWCYTDARGSWKTIWAPPGFVQTLVCLCLLLGWTAGLRQNLIAKQNVPPWRYCLISYLLAKMPAAYCAWVCFARSVALHNSWRTWRSCTKTCCAHAGDNPTHKNWHMNNTCLRLQKQKTGPSGSAFFQSSQVPLACQKCTGPSAAMQPWTG